MSSPVSGRERAPVSVVQAAIDAFNRGDINALIPDSGSRPSPRRWQRRSPDAAIAAVDERPIAVSHISSLDARRVFCALVTAHGSELVGVYALANGRIAEARHYFSDIELLVNVGILERDELEASTTPRST